jgi:6-phosphogluconolactonase
VSDEKTPAPPPGGYDGQPYTQDMPAIQPAGPDLPYPGPPAWASTPTRHEVRLRTRDRVLVGLSMLLSVSLAVVFGVPAMLGHTETASGTGTAAAAVTERTGALGTDLRSGAVFAQTNDGTANVVVAYARNANGTLREVGRYPTGGRGSGSFEDSAQGMVLGSAAGESSPIHNVGSGDLLFVPNAGSNTISVFRIRADRLDLVSKVASGGQKPVSIALTRGLLYVLNSGEFDNRLIVGQSLLENCTSGQLPSITGFKVAADGTLTQIDSSTRLLSGAAESGCSQISFTPDGRTLVVAERIAGQKDKATGHGRGALITFPVYPDGTLGSKQITEPTGDGPYAFTFTRDGTLLAVEQNGAMANPAGGLAMSYTVNPEGGLSPVGRPVATSGTDTCWIVLTDDQRYAFTTSPFGSARISTLAVGRTGGLTLLHPVASAPDGRDAAHKRSGDVLVDLALSRDSRFLYVLQGLSGDVVAFAVNENGTLTPVDKQHVVNVLPFEQGGQGGPFGLVAS